MKVVNLELNTDVPPYKLSFSIDHVLAEAQKKLLETIRSDKKPALYTIVIERKEL